MASAELNNTTIPSVTKSITQVKINQFESCGILDRENIHNSPELAQKRLGTSYTLASGRMSVAFASESLRKFFGPDVFNYTVSDGNGGTDTATITITVLGINDAPVAANNTGIINEDGTLTVADGASANSITTAAASHDSSPYDIATVVEEEPRG